MTGEEFWRRLAQDHHYETERRKPSLVSRCLNVSPALRYHLLSVLATVKGGIKARRGKYDQDAFADSSYSILRAVEKAGGTVEISGLEHVAGTAGPAVIVANHMSALETYMLPAILLRFRPIVFVVKKSLLDYPFLGTILRSMPTIAVTRENPREDFRQVLEQGTATLAQGVSVLVFPQSTRSARFDPSAFNSLGVKLAARGGVPLIPAALRTDFLVNGKWLKDFGPVFPDRTVHYRFGPAMRIEGNGKAQHQAAVDFIVRNLRDWGGSIEEGGATEGRVGESV